ncbi:MAG: DUF5654 family protein [Nanoarchaeota archaeon]
MAQTPNKTPTSSKSEKGKKDEQIWLSQQLFGSAKNKALFLKSEFRGQASTAIITAFGLVIALAWKDVITDFISKINPFTNSSLFLSAIIITIVSVIGISLVSRWFNHPEKDAKN